MPSARPMKVWGTTTTVRGKDARILVVAETKRRALELLRRARRAHSPKHFNDYWTETGNVVELAAVQNAGEGVWVGPYLASKTTDYTRIV